MKYRDVMQALHVCTSTSSCEGCPINDETCETCLGKDTVMKYAADAIEGLLCENEHLREILESRADLENVDQYQKLIHQTENALLFPAPPAPQRRGPMYIMTNDGKHIFPSSGFGCYSVFPDHTIMGTPSREFNYKTLGIYPDDEAAKAALQGLLYALASGAPFYRMPPASGQDEIPAWSETVKSC